MNMRTARGARRIDELNEGLQTLERALKDDSIAKTRVQLAIVCAGGAAGDGADVLMDWTDAKDFQAFPLVASGTTSLGKGMLLALNAVENQKQQYKSHGIGYTRPWIIVVSDGIPTDESFEWDRAIKACREAEDSGKCTIYPIGIGGVNEAKQQEISATRVLLLPELRINEMFVWLAES